MIGPLPAIQIGRVYVSPGQGFVAVYRCPFVVPVGSMLEESYLIDLKLSEGEVGTVVGRIIPTDVVRVQTAVGTVLSSGPGLVLQSKPLMPNGGLYMLKRPRKATLSKSHRAKPRVSKPRTTSVRRTTKPRP